MKRGRTVLRLLLVLLAALVPAAAGGVALAGGPHALGGGYGPATPHIGMAGSVEGIAAHPVVVAPAAQGQSWPGGVAVTVAMAALAVPVLLRARRVAGGYVPPAAVFFSSRLGRAPPGPGPAAG